MKMTGEDYASIKKGIAELLRQNSCTLEAAKRYIQKQNPKLDGDSLTIATMWRLFHEAPVQGGTGLSFCCQVLYRYLNDTHINTALKRIAKEL